MRHRLLLVDDDACARERTRTFLERGGFHVDGAGWIVQARRLLSSVCHEAVVTDLQLSAAARPRGRHPRPAAVMTTPCAAVPPPSSLSVVFPPSRGTAGITQVRQ